MSRKKRSYKRGYVRTEEHAENWRASRLGHIVSSETRLKISLAQKGKKKMSDEAKEKIRTFQLGRGKSKEYRKKMSLARRGEDNPNWKGGWWRFPYTPEFNVKLRTKIKQRDNFVCQGCGCTERQYLKKHKKKLSVHHINYVKQDCNERNFITLCNTCNVRANGNRDYQYAYYTYLIEHVVYNKT
jgi:hypothetical protein